ncbi:MAG: GerW family sporulation protein [Candidatus Limnocylindria bacterium]
MNVDELLTGARDAMSARTVFAEPIERDGLLIIPAAKVRGGGGGGSDTESNGGGGFGISAKPAGAYVVRDGQVTWQPAIDVNRMALGGQLVAIVALLVLRTWLKHRR